MGFSEYSTPNSIQSHLWAGYGKVARKQGTNTGIYRPTDPLNPFSNKIGEIPVVFTNNYGFIKPDKFGTSWLFAIFDGTTVQEGDYLITPPLSDSPTGPGSVFTNDGDNNADVFYVSSMDMNVPILVVECQRQITISRVGASSQKGFVGYSGATQATESILMQNWRASILQGTKGETNPAGLPTDIRTPWWTILLPSFHGIILDLGDIIRDDLGRKYIISSAELTDMGWRLTASTERA